MPEKVRGFVVAFLVVSVFFCHSAPSVNSACAEIPLWNLDERPHTEEELRAQLPWYLKDYQTIEGEAAWNAITPTEGGYDAYEGHVAATLPLLGNARIDASVTIERGVAYEPTAEDLARVEESTLPVYGFTFTPMEQDGRLTTAAVCYIPEEVLETAAAARPGNRLPAATVSAAGQYVKIVQVANAASLGATVQGAWDTMGRHEHLMRMLDLANDIVDNEARDLIIRKLSAMAYDASCNEFFKGGSGIGSAVICIVAAPETLGASLVVGSSGYLYGMMLDWSLDRKIEQIKHEMIDLGVDFDRPAGTVDRSGLKALVSEIEQLDEADFTAASWSRLSEALAQTKLTLGNPEMTQYHINLAIQWLSTARSAMEKNQSGFEAAPAVPGDKKRGTAFDLKITGARNEYGIPHSSGFIVTATSNIEHGALYDGEALFAGGTATVPITLYTEGAHTLTIQVVAVARSRTLPVTVVVSQEAGNGIVTIDDKFDFLPRTDGIRDTWVKQLSATADVIAAAVMYRDESGIGQIGAVEVSARLAAPLATVRLEIDKGWVFWQFLNVSAHYENWIYDPGTGQATMILTASDPDAPASGFQFQGGRVLWVDTAQGLMCFNGAASIKLADKDTFFDPVLNNGWAVWREIYARVTPVSSEDFVQSALLGFAVLCGIAIDLNLIDNDFNKNGTIDLGDIAYALQRAGGLR